MANERAGVNHLSLNSELQYLDLIDLISERHNMMRQLSEKLWDEQNDISISSSEWYIIAKIYKKQPTIAYITKNVNISRQAIHKFIRNLEAKGLININNVKHNKKEKYVELTPLGETCFEKNEALKNQIEQQIAEKIGMDEVNALKYLLTIDWGIER